jgi:hypothetical protein
MLKSGEFYQKSYPEVFSRSTHESNVDGYFRHQPRSLPQRLNTQTAEIPQRFETDRLASLAINKRAP